MLQFVDGYQTAQKKVMARSIGTGMACRTKLPFVTAVFKSSSYISSHPAYHNMLVASNQRNSLKENYERF